MTDRLVPVAGISRGVDQRVRRQGLVSRGTEVNMNRGIIGTIIGVLVVIVLVLVILQLT